MDTKKMNITQYILISQEVLTAFLKNFFGEEEVNFLYQKISTTSFPVSGKETQRDGVVGKKHVVIFSRVEEASGVETMVTINLKKVLVDTWEPDGPAEWQVTDIDIYCYDRRNGHGPDATSYRGLARYYLAKPKKKDGKWKFSDFHAGTEMPSPCLEES